MFKKITKFNQINLIKNSLVVLDIDETIIKFDNINKAWWSDTFDKHYSITKNHDCAHNLSLDDWISHITINRPKLVDEGIYDWINLIDKHNCDLIFLTARNKNLKDITHSHLNIVNLSCNKDKVYFNQEKGDELFSIVNAQYSDKKNIIVVDDVEINLIDIKNKFTDTDFNLHLYNIIM